MKKIILKLTFGILVSALIISCTDDFQEINTDPLALDIGALEDSEVLQGQAFAQAQYVSVNGLHWRFQISQNLFSDIWSQYFATTAAGFDSDRLVQVGRWADLAWGSFYGQAAPQVKLVEDLALLNGNSVGTAMAQIWRVHSYHRITDYWGPVPYSQFGNGELVVHYDSQEDIYNDFFATLDNAVSLLKSNPGGQSYAGSDRVYAGSGDMWLKFANSLRLRLALRIKYVNPAKAKSEAEKAVLDGVMENNSDNATVSVDDTNRNPIETITDWGEYRMSATMESILVGYEDPRISQFFAPAVNGDSDGDGVPYEGMVNGQARITLEQGQNPHHSDLATQYIDVAKGGINPPIEIMSAAEMYFLRAEGALQGWAMGGSAKDLYEEGIRTSMLEKTDASADAIEAYIVSTKVPKPHDNLGSLPVTDIPVAFSADAEKQFEQIMTQKWLCLYPNGWEAWAEVRRTGYPKHYARLFSQNPDVGVNEVPRRMVYTASEFDTNGDAVNAAIGTLSGGDKNSTKLWWDAK